MPQVEQQRVLFRSDRETQVRRDRLVDEIGVPGVALLRSLKRALDPENLMNPGVLLPDPAASGGAV